MAYIQTVIFFLISLPGPIDDASRPPKLTFDKKVDYVAWWNARISKGKRENALDLYKGLYDEMSENGNENGKRGISAISGEVETQYNAVAWTRWEPKDYPELAEHIRKNEQFLEIYRNATKRKDYWQPVPADVGSLFELLLPILSSHRVATKLLITDAWMNRDQQAVRFMSAHRTILLASAHMQQDGSLISKLVGLAERSLVYSSTNHAIGQKLIPRSESGRLYESMREADPGSPSFESVVLMEWAMGLDGIRYVCPDGKLNADRSRTFASLAGTTVDAATIRLLSTKTVPSRCVEVMDDYFNTLVELTKGPYRGATTRAVSALFQEFRKKNDENPLVLILVGDVSRAYELFLRGETHRRGTMLTLALLAHHHKTGHWPKSLDDIDPSLNLKGLKTFRIDPHSGKPFRYELRDGQPWLWSIGADGKDDNARHDPKWGEGKDGGDFVFWPYGGEKKQN